MRTQEGNEDRIPGGGHASDCAVHNAPAYKPGHCDCGADKTDVSTPVAREDDIVKHVKHMFGWHGGMGDPPEDDAIRAIVRGTREYVVKALGQKIAPWTGKDER